jgi:hypothetical protein
MPASAGPPLPHRRVAQQTEQKEIMEVCPVQRNSALPQGLGCRSCVQRPTRTAQPQRRGGRAGLIEPRGIGACYPAAPGMPRNWAIALTSCRETHTWVGVGGGVPLCCGQECVFVWWAGACRCVVGRGSHMNWGRASPPLRPPWYSTCHTACTGTCDPAEPQPRSPRTRAAPSQRVGRPLRCCRCWACRCCCRRQCRRRGPGGQPRVQRHAGGGGARAAAALAPPSQTLHCCHRAA